MMQNMFGYCQQMEHERYQIQGFCLNDQCKSYICQKCLKNENHYKHMDQIFFFQDLEEQIQSLQADENDSFENLIKYISEISLKVNKYFKQQQDKFTALKEKKMEIVYHLIDQQQSGKLTKPQLFDRLTQLKQYKQQLAKETKQKLSEILEILEIVDPNEGKINQGQPMQERYDEQKQLCKFSQRDKNILSPEKLKKDEQQSLKFLPSDLGFNDQQYKQNNSDPLKLKQDNKNIIYIRPKNSGNGYKRQHPPYTIQQNVQSLGLQLYQLDILHVREKLPPQAKFQNEKPTPPELLLLHEKQPRHEKLPQITKPLMKK